MIPNAPFAAARPTLTSIQYLRAAAAIAVIASHTDYASVVIGHSGVDLFFVISGSVMMLVSRTECSPGRFAVARAARIVPMYWTVTIVAALLFRSPPAKVASSLFFWPDGGFPILIQGWSLNLEIVYYAVFALTLLAPSRLRLPVLAAAMAVLCLVLPPLLPASVPLTAWSSPMAFEFLAGAGLYAVWRHGYVPVGRVAWLLGAAGLIALAGTPLLGHAPSGWLRVALWGGPAVAIVAAGLGIEAACQLPRLPVLDSLGGASYATYLTHFIAIRLVAEPLSAFSAPVAVSLAIIWACLVGYATHLLFELPVHRLTTGWLRSLWPKPQSTPA